MATCRGRALRHAARSSELLFISAPFCVSVFDDRQAGCRRLVRLELEAQEYGERLYGRERDAAGLPGMPTHLGDLVAFSPALGRCSRSR
jgi:hypothetical protein